MKLVRLTKRNLKLGLKTAYSCFTSKSDKTYVKKWYTKFVNSTFRPDCSMLEYFIAFDKKPVGVTGFYSTNDSKIWLGFFGVVPEARRKGIGSSILKETMKKVHGKFFVWTVSKKAAIFYEKNGFRKVKVRRQTFGHKTMFVYPKSAMVYSKRI